MLPERKRMAWSLYKDMVLRAFTKEIDSAINGDVPDAEFDAAKAYDDEQEDTDGMRQTALLALELTDVFMEVAGAEDRSE